ncbi:MAG: proline--tRNA ligase [Candidatus Krumholzibacteria bacterium]|jgi:prolyl-tRNA synthetase|nr:proline--tRNA ligase [Candidatus Krumholzibacteria bacterium]MDP6668472.1 proline--tRNA ligase [Candidatus Krumholzibacteria bacterium]MDP6797366.1 proline--tRNA ligase [Candidatus Krumholzibacteria bacterium]MDP7021565.1 proline--tRNA ligase [Candidatus Krumholzibacteria bacterium]
MSEGLAKQAEDYSRWYTDVVQKAELADYSPVKGSMVIRPYGYGLWENMQKDLDRRFKETGHVNAYFPMLIPESFLKKEAEHVEGFAPELAVVTHGGGKKLEEPLVIRPTSETIIWDMYRKWIQSHRDLPLLINQWANVVRWEMRTRLFLRTTEFLWQEGHTAHATAEEAEEETLRMLDVYADFAENEMAMPVVKGRKTEREKFAGAVRTYSIEALMGDLRGLQSGTSHNLGQNFAKAFDVTYQDEHGERQHVWATSWGVSTRLVGGLVMCHGDDQGLILPPRLAPIQTVIIPIYKSDEEREATVTEAERVAEILRQGGLRVHIDDRDNFKPGWKYAEWELKGVPLRLEIGPKDLEKKSVFSARRDIRKKEALPVDTILESVSTLLETIQREMFERADQFRKDNTRRVDNWEEFKQVLEEKGGYLYAHWDGSTETEEAIQDETKATIRCIPLDEDYEDGLCVYSGKPSKRRVLFAKAY